MEIPLYGGLVDAFVYIETFLKGIWSVSAGGCGETRFCEVVDVRQESQTTFL